MRCSLTRAIAFHAKHQYPEAVAHGHLYRIEVTVTGTLDPVTQMVVDLVALDDILTNAITLRLEGRQLNEAIPAFASGGQWPSCEAVAAWCWREVASRLPAQVGLQRVRVAEDETLWADCTGPI